MTRTDLLKKANKSAHDTCPTCGSRVIRHTSVEGTGCYIPTSPTDDDREWADRPGLVAVTPQTLEATRRSKMTIPPITKEERAMIVRQRVVPERFMKARGRLEIALAYEAHLQELISEREVIEGLCERNAE